VGPLVGVLSKDGLGGIGDGYGHKNGLGINIDRIACGYGASWMALLGVGMSSATEYEGL